ncbi:MAG: 16S rRNA (adenine(1518)-N(6)/adenine(1519)-N(6))-dimethyltransferase RsmA [Myxococcota bacterium]|nr:16S rRNA (adenine(1518)-N(6)/adenine(1519)-N(6))-dimethyltransferase RsmA [Myxococcota bacterium]
MSDVPPLRELLDRHSLRLRRELGQNFLVDPREADRLVDAAGVQEGEGVVEVGTGLGQLTRALASRASRVSSFEIDSGLVRTNREEGLLPDNVELVHADALKVDLETHIEALREACGAPVRFVANLPYASATPMLRRLLDLRGKLAGYAVMLQLEVADRLFAEVGTRDYGSFAVLHHLCVEAVGRRRLPAAAFFPVPKIDSAFVTMRSRAGSWPDRKELRAIERVARAAFGKRRKTLSNALKGGGFGLAPEEVTRVIEGCDIDPRVRAETLEPAVFATLANGFAHALARVTEGSDNGPD